MKIAVCVKVVPDGHARLDPATRRVDRSIAAAVNHFDLNAVEEALRIRDAAGEGEVVALTMAPVAAAEALRKVLAMGADRTVLVSDDGLGGADLVATSRVLAAALAREAADLVLLGQQGSDSEGALLWAALAERLRLPLVSQATTLELTEGRIRARRQTETGYETIEAPLPAVVGVSDSINEPRYPSLKGIMAAKSKPQETLALADLGLSADDAAPRTAVLSVGPPVARSAGRTIEDDGTAAEQIVAFLRERTLL